VKIESLVSQSTNRLNASVTAYPYFVNSQTDLSNVGIEWSIAEHQKITSGFENTKQTLLSDTQYKNNSRNNNAYRLGYLLYSTQHQVQLNVRQDHYTDFGQSQTGLLAYAFKVNEAVRFNANLSNGFMAPTFNDLYYPYGGNPNLKAEKLNSNEFGFTLRNGPHSLQMTHFNNQYKDLIDNDANYVRTNIASAQNIGTEAIYTGTFIDRVCQCKLYTTKSHQSFDPSATLKTCEIPIDEQRDSKFDAFSLAAEVKNSSSRFDGVNHVLDEYTLFNLSISKDRSTVDDPVQK
jgi:outer membrane cobalamin receptor